VVIALWLYALSRGVREARALDAWAQYGPGCQWLLGPGRIHYHTLSDFVTAQAAAEQAQVRARRMNEREFDGGASECPRTRLCAALLDSIPPLC
jgi:hypothetical protein